MRRLCAPVVLACLWLTAAASGQSAHTPNFSGIWLVNLEKSDFGGVPAPGSAKYAIRHIHSNITMDYTQDSATKRVEAVTDGQERITESDDESEVWTRAYWSGPVLVWEARKRPKPAHETVSVSWTSRWSLSPDRKTLTIERRITAADQTANQTIVFDKQQ